MIKADNYAFINTDCPFNSLGGYVACLKDWELNAIMKQLVKSTCVNVVWIMQMVQICISPVRSYELELKTQGYGLLSKLAGQKNKTNQGDVFYACWRLSCYVHWQ